jgi:hypothetical protein
MRALYLATVLFAASVVQTPGQTNSFTQDVFPGDTVPENFTQGKGPSTTDPIKVTLTWDTSAASLPTGCSSSVNTESGAGTVTTTGFSFAAPKSLCVGQYSITAAQQIPKTGGGITSTDIPNLPVPKLQVKQTPTVTEKPVVTGISPKALFREDELTGTDYYSLVFFGPSSLMQGPNDSIRIRDHVLPSCDAAKRIDSSKIPICFKIQPQNAGSPGGEIAFELHDGTGEIGQGNPRVLDKLSGPQFLSFVHNGAESDPQRVLFVDATNSAPRNIAIGVAAALILLTYLLLSAGRRSLPTGTNGRTFFLTALFLDEETMTYSLSKCQFYAWTLAAILGYVFLAVSMSVIQGSAVFPDIPAGLPGILIVSVGTGVLATIITNSRGTKGAGEVHPSLADFITSGGVVAPERLQFVVWTVVGIFTFLTIVFKSNPMTVADLPRIPDGFLQLMGISSAGYLAGKLARKPGPVIKAVSVTTVATASSTSSITMPPPNSTLPEPPPGFTKTYPILTLNVKGENLDPDALVKLDGQPLAKYQYWITHGTPDPQTKFCSELNVSLNNAAAYIEGTHTLTIVNNDAQAADVLFPVDGMTIVSVLPDTSANPPTNANVTGTNFTQKPTAAWKDDKGNTLPVLDADVTLKSATEVTVKLGTNVTPKSNWKLVLTSPVGLRVSHNY